ncbi:short chain dehydrogenase [Cribrihabitans marinus]|uniref:Short chain dehydrogenase n=1 Tax=Cribrihabitans marinus TaxID=1227549 RepID=A0A1H7CUG1_9RHOB|nr:SDR family NAD(P)-dependent oxidoreductase [Cribrihabitans marinus]GGH36527.1 short-chain dehydrogenase [Cribrihabitans marinus]SEJ92217.1 short chain dehydrogenase [Cribrihabitans marinus]
MYQNAISEGGLAVVTGAASGVGRVAALRFAQAGMGVILADLSGSTLDEAVAEVRSVAGDGAEVLGVPTDVSQDADMDALADKAFATGPVAVLMNNAGIGLATTAWTELDNWRRLLDVNFLGVLRGVHAFLPRMIAANRPAVVINTGSKQGITSPPGNPGYNVSKAAVKVLTEQLAHELRQADAPITAHLFVPGFTYTGMIASFISEKPPSAWTSEQTVDYFIDRMAKGDFYILCPDNDVDETRDRRRVEWAVRDVSENRPALSRWHPDYAEAFARFEDTGRT